jgi:hypothetical protein
MTQKLRCFLLSLCWLGGATVAHAQTNFRPGYVLPLTGDTLRGEVDSREGRTNAQRCRFRATAQAEVTTYQPADLRGYGLPLEQRHYRSLPVTIAPAPVRSYFLEVLVDGPAKLYFLRDAEQHESFYVESPKQPLTLLEHSKTIVQGNGIAKIEEKNLYRNTLAAALAGCVQAQSKLPNLPFQESALRQVVNLYNQCVGYAAPQAKFAGVPTHATIGIMAAVSGQRLYFDGFPFASDITSQQTGFAIGPVLHVSSSRVSQRLSLVVALLYEPEKYEVGPSRNPYASPDARVRFDLAYLRLPVMVRYTYPRGKIVPIAEAGFTIAYAVKTDVSSGAIVNGRYTAFSSSVTELLANSMRSTQVAFGAGLGLRTHVAGGRAIALLARAERSNGFTNSNDTGTSTAHLYGVLTFDLTK